VSVLGTFLGGAISTHRGARSALVHRLPACASAIAIPSRSCSICGPTRAPRSPVDPGSLVTEYLGPTFAMTQTLVPQDRALASPSASSQPDRAHRAVPAPEFSVRLTPTYGARQCHSLLAASSSVAVRHALVSAGGARSRRDLQAKRMPGARAKPGIIGAGRPLEHLRSGAPAPTTSHHTRPAPVSPRAARNPVILAFTPRIGPVCGDQTARNELAGFAA
jgi:hypothetical protein